MPKRHSRAVRGPHRGGARGKLRGSLPRVYSLFPTRLLSRSGFALSLAIAWALCACSKPEATPVPAATASASANVAASSISAAASASASIASRAASSAPNADTPNSEAASELAEISADKPVRWRPLTPAKAGEVIAISAGVFHYGSFGDEDGRDPAVDAPARSQSMPAFEIDALPYPNDPAAPIRVNVPYREAAKLCESRGARLCSDAEWSRACRGPDDTQYASGAQWDKACAKDGAMCTSGFGARMLGSVREWTLSPAQLTAAAAGREARADGYWIKGATSLPPNYRLAQGAHRCGRRAPGGEGLAMGDLSFRCCKGPTTEVAIVPEARLEPSFAKRHMTSAEGAALLRAIPELARLTGDIRLNDVGDAHVIEVKGDTPTRGYQLSSEPVVWNPEAGSELLVLTGRAKNASFIAVVHPPRGDAAGERAHIAAYFLMLGDVVPIAVAFHPDRRRDLLWTTCWGCYGDHGHIRVESDHRVVVVQDPTNAKDEPPK